MIISIGLTEDSSVTVLGRVTARNATGAATGVDGEGNWIEQVDVSTITFKLFDLNGATPDTETESGTLTVANVILDTPVTTKVIWTADDTGYNFIHDLPATYFPAADNRYRIEYKFTLTGGEVFHAVYQGQTKAIRGS